MLQPYPVHNCMQVVSGPPGFATSANVGDEVSTGSLQVRSNTSSSVFSNPHSGPSMADSDTNKQDTTYPTMFPFTPSQSEASLETTSTDPPTLVQNTAIHARPCDLFMVEFSNQGPSTDTIQEQHRSLSQVQEDGQSTQLATERQSESTHENGKLESPQKTIDISEDMSVSQAWKAINSHFDTDNKPGPSDVPELISDSRDDVGGIGSIVFPLSLNNSPGKTGGSDSNACTSPDVQSVKMANVEESAVCSNINPRLEENAISIPGIPTSPRDTDIPKDPFPQRDTSDICQGIPCTITSPRLQGARGQDSSLYDVPVTCRMAHQVAELEREAGSTISPVLPSNASTPVGCPETTAVGQIDVFSHLFKDD